VRTREPLATNGSIWLNEAEEWARFAEPADPYVDSPPLQLELFQSDLTN
jgi:hypothetical protein